MKIRVPKVLGIRNNKMYLFISEMYHKLKKENSIIIEVDFSRTKWVDPSVCSILAMVFDYFIDQNMLKFHLVGLSNTQVKLFKNNSFLSKKNNDK